MKRTPLTALSIGLAGFFAFSSVQAEMVSDPQMDAPALWQADPSRIFNANEVDLNDFKWLARPIVVFATSDRDPAFVQQMDRLTQRMDALIERDVVIIVDTDPDTLSDLRTKLRPRGFMLVLIGKEGEVALRKPFPWDVRELSRSIDKMPLRKQELRGGR